MTKVTGGLLTIAAGIAVFLLPVPAGVTQQAWNLLALFVATIIGFILQPLSIGGVAFVSIAFAMLAKILTPAQALSGFSNATIWLIVSAFMFSRAFIKTGLGKRIAYIVMKALGDSTLKLSYALIISDLIIAPATPSNTARGGGIIYPIIKSISTAFGSEPGPTTRKIGAFLVQSCYQGNCITSAMFMTSMAGNPLVVTLAAKTLNISITWGMWALAAIVPGILSLIIIPYFIYKIYPPEVKYTPEAQDIAGAELAKLGEISNREKIVSAVFVGALLLWCTSQYTGLNATTVAVLAVSAMLISSVLSWQDIIEEKSAWDTMIWMGALVGLADHLGKLGLIPWFAKLVSTSIGGIDWITASVILILIYFYSQYIFASLTAHITAMFPAFAAVAVAAGAPPYAIALIMGCFSSLCASLTHYASGVTPIYFGSNYVDQGTWWKLGFYTSLINIVIWLGIGTIWWKIIGLW